MPIKAFIFDLDGVITDTAEYHFLAWKRLADEENVPFTREDNDQLRGLSRRTSLLTMLKGRTVAEATMQTWMERKNTYYLEYLKRITPADRLPGVTRVIEEAQSTGIRIGLGSASKNARDVLTRLDLLHAFDIIGDGYSVINSKPAPDLFVWVAGGLRVTVPEAVVFEDAEAGVEAALKAGFWTVGLGGANLARAHIVLPNLADERVSDILSRVEALRSTRG
ncbi:MAG: beta-phosphoglucomutase [Chloroflexota bacterium]|nr:beta-phosphoglucomutase [Chloroflexota bacterium]